MSDPFSINGGAAVAMIGKDCIAIASDLRLGQQSLGVSNNFEKIFSVGDKTFLGLTGLATDVISLKELWRFGPWFVSPIVAGLSSKDNKPFICGFDSIGCIDFSHDFIVSGTASDQLYGMCESLYEPNLEPEDLFETISQALLNAVDRDALSGWGAVVYIVTKDKVIKRVLKTRQDWFICIECSQIIHDLIYSSFLVGK